MADNDPFPNADKLGDFIESEQDPTVRALMRLVHGEFLKSCFREDRPHGAADMLYCFRLLRTAFHQKEAFANAMQGNFGDLEAGSNWG
jgi:hypothetical protein